MRKLFVLTVAALSLATTVAHGESLLARLRGKDRTRLDRDPLVKRVAFEQAVPTPALPSLPYEANYQPVPQSLPTPAEPAPYVVQPEVQPAPIVGMPIPATLALYTNVKVRAPRNIHPCAAPMIVSAPDPCNPCCQVCVEICAPPCCVAEVKCRKDGRRLIYDFGDYEVSLTARKNHVVVAYSD